MSDSDLKSPGAQKLLLEYLTRAEDEITVLKHFQEKYHEADKDKGVLEEKLKISRASEAISMASLATGAAALGYAPMLTSTPSGGWFAVAFGTVLVCIGIAAKVIRK